MEQLSINGAMFTTLRNQFDEILNQTVANMMLKGAQEASMSIKINIGLVEEIERTDEGAKEILLPVFEHDISSAVQVKERAKGSMDGDYELVKNVANNKWEVNRIIREQISMFDEKEEPGENTTTDYMQEVSLFDMLKPYVGDDMLMVMSEEGLYEIIDATALNPVVIASASNDGRITGIVGLEYAVMSEYEGQSFTIDGATKEGAIDYASLSLVCKDDGKVFITVYPD